MLVFFTGIHSPVHVFSWPRSGINRSCLVAACTSSGFPLTELFTRFVPEKPLNPIAEDTEGGIIKSIKG
jgi:hypothetical protein